MEVRNGYKETDIGTIPNDWEFKPIEGEIDLLTGYPFPSNKYSQNGIRLLRGSNVKRNITDWSDDITQYWEKLAPELNQYLLEDGDIVIAMDGSLVGRSFARLSKRDLPALLLQRVARVRSNKIDNGYLKEFICSDYFTKYCDKVKTSSAIPHISPGDIKRFSIPLPPTVQEQTAIAKALSDTDALITSLEKLIAKKRNIKQGAMQELLKPKKGWEVEELDSNIDLLTGFPFPSDKYSANGIRLLRGSNIKRGVTDWSEDITQYWPSVTAELKKYTLDEGDIVIAMDGSLVGRSFAQLSKKDLPAVLLQRVARVRSSKIDMGYLKEFICSEFFSKYCDTVKTSSAIPHISPTDIRKFEIPIPPTIEEQKQIASTLSDMTSEITTLEGKLEKYRQVKSGMMQNLLTGKIRLV